MRGLGTGGLGGEARLAAGRRRHGGARRAPAGRCEEGGAGRAVGMPGGMWADEGSGGCGQRWEGPARRG